MFVVNVMDRWCVVLGGEGVSVVKWRVGGSVGGERGVGGGVLVGSDQSGNVSALKSGEWIGYSV